MTSASTRAGIEAATHVAMKAPESKHTKVAASIDTAAATAAKSSSQMSSTDALSAGTGSERPTPRRSNITNRPIELNASTNLDHGPSRSTSMLDIIAGTQTTVAGPWPTTA
jgi:hypothetical protein